MGDEPKAGAAETGLFSGERPPKLPGEQPHFMAIDFDLGPRRASFRRGKRVMGFVAPALDLVDLGLERWVAQVGYPGSDRLVEPGEHRLGLARLAPYTAERLG